MKTIHSFVIITFNDLYMYRIMLIHGNVREYCTYIVYYSSIMYADDTSVLMSDNDLKALFKRLFRIMFTEHMA